MQAGLQQFWSRLEAQYGLPPGYMARTAQIESANNPRAVSPTGASGLFQFTKGTARQYGLPLEARFDPIKSSEAAARLARDNMGFLAQRLGRQPTAGETYLAHQQGAGGASSLLANMNRPAGSVTDPRNISVNAGNPNAPASEFVNKFLSKFNGASPGANTGQGPTNAAAAAMAGRADTDSNHGSAMGPAIPAGYVAPDPTRTLMQDKGLVGGLMQMANSTEGITGAGIKSFLGQGGGAAGIAQGVTGLVSALAGGQGGGAAPQVAPLVEQANAPDMSLLAMIGKRRKKLGMV